MMWAKDIMIVLKEVHIFLVPLANLGCTLSMCMHLSP